MQNQDSIDKIVRLARKHAGLSQAELAEMAGVGRATVQQLEAGKLSIQLDTLLKICGVLNIKIDFISPVKTSSREDEHD